MTIPQIKARLPMAAVLNHYHLKPDKKLRLCCPFHEDKTPSMQVYYKTQTAYCFSGNCTTHGRSLDVIDFVMHKEGCTKHEAIERCKAMAGGEASAEIAAAVRPKPMTELSRAAVLLKVWTYMRNAVSGSKTARGYLASRGLDYKRLEARGLEVGYQGGQMHHGARAERHLIESLLRVGLLSEVVGGRNTRSGGPAYRTFAKGSVAFALRDSGGKVCGLYFRSIGNEGKAGRHYYLRDRQGLYPRYPAPEARRLLLTESVIDAASVLRDEATAAGWEVLALYGTNGYTTEHAAAVAGLDKLEEVCVMLNGDDAGRRATASVAAKIRGARPGVRVTVAGLPEGEDCNSILAAEGPELLAHLIEEREPVAGKQANGAGPSSSTEDTTETGAMEAAQRTEPEAAEEPAAGALDASDAYDIGYRGRAARLRVKGLRADQLDTLRVTLQIEYA